MRIGLVLFGHLRSFRSAFDSFQLLKATLETAGAVDVFCHTWDIEESVTASWWKENKPGDKPPATVNVNEIDERYNPVRYIVEPSRQFDDSGYNVKSTIPVAGILSMLYSQRQAFRLLEQYSEENKVAYDVVIKSRYDLLYEIAPSFPRLISECITYNCLYLPTSNPYELGGSYSDVFVMGPMKLVKEYFSFADDFKNALDRHQQKGYGTFLPEHCLTLYLEEKNIRMRELVGLRIQILRLNGDKFQINSDKDFSGNGPLCFFRETIEINKKVLDLQRELIEHNSLRLARKYMSWVDKDADDATLQQYADLYSGKWIGISRIKRLAQKSRSNQVFVSHVMKNFFEEALSKAKYSNAQKLLFASTLTAYAGYGFFFFRVLKNIFFKKHV